ncbi:MAG: tetratricopeptide repeat protein, partial [Planctomycetaceae bacterium]|nr:tetratricopeptide repeat protein [Planctomycetaceae bacterium]
IAEAIQILEKLHQDHPDVVKYADELRLANMHMGLIYFKEDRFDEAEPLLKELLDYANDENKTLDAYDRRLVLVARLNYAKLLRKKSDLTGAKQQLTKVLDVCEQWQKESPEDLSPKFGIADAQGTLGEMAQDKDHTDEALQYYQIAIDHAETLLASEPQSSNYRLLWSRYALRFAKIRLVQGHRNEAKQISERVVERLSPFVRTRQTRSTIYEFLVRAHNIVAEVLRNQDQFQASIERCDISLELNDNWKNAIPQERESLRGTTLATKILALKSLGQHEEAVDLLEEAIPIADPPVVVTLLEQKMVLLLRTGRYGEALESANAWRKDSSKAVQATRTYRVVIFLSEAMATLASDADLPTSQRESLQTDYAKQAMELLDELNQLGLFENPKNVKDLNTRSSFEPLRQREEFQSWWSSRTSKTDHQ